MEDITTFQLNYTEDEVVSAKRMHFRNSVRFKAMVALGLIGTIGFTVELIYIWHRIGTVPTMWDAPINIAAIFILILALIYFVGFRIEARVNSAWRYTLNLSLLEDRLRLTAKGNTESFDVLWQQVRRILENEKAYNLYYGPREEDYLILPKRILQSEENASYFRDILKGKVASVWKVTR